MSHRVKLWQLALTFAVACAALTVHFTCTILYVLPANPLNVRYHHVINAYMTPVFAQNWSLFAPNPPYESKSVLVGCRILREDGSVEEKAVVDVTHRLMELQRAFRLTPATYLMRVQLGPLPVLFPKKSDLEQRIEGATDITELEQARQSIEERREALHARGVTMMTRIASAECRRLHPGQQISEVRPVAMLESVPKFSQRHLESAPTEHRAFDLGWQPYVTMAPL